MDRYDPHKIEEKWQRVWEEKKAFKVTEDKDKMGYYLLEMFPYPSGRIHMGHIRNYSIGDVIARFKMMRGYNVLHPMGWDAFGLPAENAAIEHGIHPIRWTCENIAHMKRQLKRMGFSYDWDREITTSYPEYYKWNQWFFLKMYERGLAYRRHSPVNWCPECQTVLANEQVEGGCCWRCNTLVEEKGLEQWFLKITAYAEELLEFCDRLPGWPERVLVMQRNWIGRSEGAEVDFPVEGADLSIRVFTTRPDTLYGATFMSLAPEHPMVERIVASSQWSVVSGFIENMKKQGRRAETLLEKEGVFTGAYCINPLTDRKMPIYVANFVLMEYGTGAVMAVPTHDQRDFEFARRYGLPMVVVIQPPGETLVPTLMTQAYLGDGIMVNSGPFDGMDNRTAMEAIVKLLEDRGIGKRAISYKIRDWGISRQRYWGCPIPIIYCDRCGIVPVPYEDLPVILPEDVKFTGIGASPLAQSPEFLNTTCPKCRAKARRESDTMDTFVDSSWYFLRYTSPGEDKRPFNPEAVRYWMPVDQYIGGIEHAVLHLLYARFFNKVLRDLGLVNLDEPFTNLLTQGMVCKETIRCPEHGYLFPDEVMNGRCPICNIGVEAGPVEKMSKSKKNIVDPDRIIERYGADTTRLFSLFAAPPEKDLDWSDEGVEGAYRFLNRVWRLVSSVVNGQQSDKKWSEKDSSLITHHSSLTSFNSQLWYEMNWAIKRVTEDMERFHFNTAIAALMEYVNFLYRYKDTPSAFSLQPSAFIDAVETLLILLSPFAPHMCEELWQMLGNKGMIINTPWPSWSEDALKREEVLVVVQINGKVRSRINVPLDAPQREVEEMAFANEMVKRWTRGKTVRRVVYVPNKLLSVVVG